MGCGTAEGRGGEDVFGDAVAYHEYFGGEDFSEICFGGGNFCVLWGGGWGFGDLFP